MLRSFTGYIDLAQLVLYAFWLFFAALVFYLHRENKREGYALESEQDRTIARGFPEPPPSKTFRSHDGDTFVTPLRGNDRADALVEPTAPWAGAPYRPVGDPMRDGVGPASFADRADVPERGMSGQAIIMPLRKALAHSVAPDGPNPVGMLVLDRYGAPVGTVVEIWIDEAESIIRYLEVEIAEVDAVGGTRLLPMAMARVRQNPGRVEVASIRADQFGGVPTLKARDEVTKREEDRISAYFAGGVLYGARTRFG